MFFFVIALNKVDLPTFGKPTIPAFNDINTPFYNDTYPVLLLHNESKNYTTLFVAGNHENYDALYTYPVEKWNGGLVHKIRDHVFHLMNGQVYEINGKTFFVMGGATSLDKMYRVEHDESQILLKMVE